MEVDLNKDFTKFRKESGKGFTRRELLFGGGVAIVLVGGISFFFYVCKVPFLISVYMILPVAIVLVLFVFYRPDDLSFWEWLKKERNRKLLVYKDMAEEMESSLISEETKKNYISFLQDFFQEKYKKIKAFGEKLFHWLIKKGKILLGKIKNKISIMKSKNKMPLMAQCGTKDVDKEEKNDIKKNRFI